MYESKYDPKDVICPAEVEIICISCGFEDFVIGNIINGELFLSEDEPKCSNCTQKRAGITNLRKRRYHD